MAGLCEGGNEPSGSLKAICNEARTVKLLPVLGRRHKCVLSDMDGAARPSGKGADGVDCEPRLHVQDNDHLFYTERQEGE
ncbi:hypothetical protein ANN_00156 [Periplaneta americana]|uniref:Uncharacterized protein n=1 Tax=Periplaneta americana TaxID=6978 RepID=A0ABQ8TQ19_PERAM|nr:hypothetical protein ANN_00156 [Periplaneta americana]